MMLSRVWVQSIEQRLQKTEKDPVTASRMLGMREVEDEGTGKKEIEIDWVNMLRQEQGSKSLTSYLAPRI